MTDHPFHVTIHGSRGDEWRELLGTATLPVVSPVPHTASAPGLPQADFYKLALEAIPADWMGLIVRHLAHKFGLSEANVLNDIMLYGIPILADDCAMTIHRPEAFF